MNEILIPFVAFWFTSITGLPQKLPITNRKPLNCGKCLSFWLALAYQLYIGFTLQSLFIIPLSSMGAYLIERVFIKLRLPYN
jgi:hypothetical protein